MNRTRQNGRGKRRRTTLSSSLFLLLALLVFALWGGAKNNAARGDDRYEEELEYTGEEHSEETRNERVPSARGETSRTARNGRGETVPPRNNIGNTFAQLAGERVGPDVVSLGPNAEQLKLTQFEECRQTQSPRIWVWSRRQNHFAGLWNEPAGHRLWASHFQYYEATIQNERGRHGLFGCGEAQGVPVCVPH